MTLRKQLAALLAAGALGLATIGTVLAAGNTGVAGGESAAPSDVQSHDPVSEPPVSEPVITEAPSFVQSENPETTPPETTPPETTPPDTAPPVTDTPPPPPTPTFFQSEEGETDTPSEPDTATIGESDASGSPADGAWLLVVALGMLLASIVVLTPVRAKNRR